MGNSRKILNPLLPGGLLSPLSGADELTANEETLVTNQQSGIGSNETPSGTINGVNAVFTLARSPSPAGSLTLYLNGQLQHAAGLDYTLASGNQITFVSAPLTGSTLRAWYFVDTDT